MPIQTYKKERGFTVVELLIAVVIIAILVVISVVAYNGIQRNAAKAVTMNTLQSARKSVGSEVVFAGGGTPALPSDFQPSSDVDVSVVPMNGVRYNGLSAVQNGVLFYEICTELIADPQYSTIHAREGGGTSSVVMRCNDSISAGQLQITGWQTRNWSVPVTEAAIQNYINSVPYDSWWTDRQDVVRGFYTALKTLFVARGGTWPITSFWDPWANQWSGVPKQELPPPESTSKHNYCIVASHRKHTNLVFHTKGSNGAIVSGACS